MRALRERVRDDDGLSLVEMMVAILVLGIIMTALAATLVTSVRTAGRQEGDIQANAVANAVVEELQGLPYRDMALCEAEAVGHFGSASFEGEALVLLADTDPRCSEPERAVPVRTVVQDGRDYTATSAITWLDDDSDGAGAADVDSPQDYKRIVVDLSWNERGVTRTDRIEARRAPEAQEQPMSVDVSPLVTELRDEGDGIVGRNRTAFTMSAIHQLEQSSVTATWREREAPDDRTAALATSDGGHTWSFTIPYNDGLFANGETLFEFTATSPSGEVTTVLTRALFLHDLEYMAHSVTPTVSVLPDGTACEFSASAQMQGMLLSDTLEIAFSAGPTETFAMTAVQQTVRGADFVFSRTNLAGFPDPATTPSITVTFHADRVIDPPAAAVTASQTVGLVGVEACP